MALHQIAWFGTTPIGAPLMGWVVCAAAVVARRAEERTVLTSAADEAPQLGAIAADS